MQKPTEWLVTKPEGKEFGEALTAACGGNKNLQKLLNYFLFHARLEADNQKLEPKTVEHITIHRTQDQILQSLEKHHSLKTTKKTLIAWVLKLQNYKYLQADARRQAYYIDIKAIQSALNTPPEPEVILRGRYAPKSPKVKTTICSLESDSPKVKTTNQAQIVVGELELQINSLQLQIVDLQIVVSREAALRADLEAKYASLYSKLLDITKKESNVSSIDPATSSANEEKPANVVSFQEKTGVVVEEPQTSNPLPDEEVTLTQEEQAVYDLVFKSRVKKQKRTQKVKEHLAAMAPHVKTLEDLQALEPYAREGLTNPASVLFVGNYFNGLDAWLQAKKIAEQPKPAPTGSKNNKNGTLTGHPNGVDYIKAMEEKYMNSPRPKRTLNLDFKAKAN